jgi:filamentous hemagglutinin family protein
MNTIPKLPFQKKLARLLATIITLLVATQGQAEIITDGTLGPASNLAGPDFRIGPELGVTVGTNLFHSFARFNVHSGEIATFTGPDSLHNVISRVTGGSVSTIDGLLRSEAGTADVYFINPAGVIFGPNARVDVPASFHAGTADELRFADGSVFSATTPATSSLTAEAPESFGYLGLRATSLLVNGSQLAFAPESSVSLSGGDVIVQGNETDAARIAVPGGELRISAVGNQSYDVPLTGELNVGEGKFQATQARIETCGNGGGRFRIAAGEASVIDATLAADNTGDEAAGDSEKTAGIMISVVGLLEVLNDGRISSTTYATGDAGRVEIAAKNLRIDGRGADYNTEITSSAGFFSGGNAGRVSIMVSELMEVLSGGQISSDTWSAGNAGEVNIEAGQLRVDGREADAYTCITSSASAFSDGKAGTVTIKVDDLLEVVNNGQIASSTYGSGDAGEINIKAGNMRIDGRGSLYFTGITSRSGYGAWGNAGTVTIRIAGLLELLNGGRISNDTDTAGDAGGIEIETECLRIDGQGYGLYTGITSDATPWSSGNAGTVKVKVADRLEILKGGQISTNAYGSGDSRGLVIETENLRIDGQGSSNFTGIRSDAQLHASGKAGTVKIKVPGLLELVSGGQISSSSFGSGDAGEVTIEAGNLRIDGQGLTLYTGIGTTSESSSSGNAGTVTIGVAGLLEVLNGGTISSSTFSSGNAGNVNIFAGDLLIDDQGAPIATYIASASIDSAEGFAGNLDIVAEKLTVRNEGDISISTDQMVSAETLSLAGKAHLLISSPVVILEDGAWISARSLGNVPAAAIGIETDNFIASGNSRITTASTGADGGPIVLQGTVIDLRNSLITSSVTGFAGNGGDITLKGAAGTPAKALILEGGFIQANAPAGARGGDIFIDARAVVPEGGALEVGGLERQRFEPGGGKNVIQAAAPGGEQGTIEITSPELDISGSLVNLDARLSETLRLAADPCLGTTSIEASSLTFTGSGGVPVGPDQHAALFFDGDRLDRIWVPQEGVAEPHSAITPVPLR